MKKTLTLLLVVLTTVAFGQTNWSIKSIKSPTELETTNATIGTELDLIIECENLGPDTIFTGDSVIFNMLVFNPADTKQPLLEYPAGANNGNFSINLITKQVLPGETYDITKAGLVARLFVRNSLPIVIGVESYILNRTNPIADTDSTNNSKGISTIWYNEYRNGVSVNEANYNNNISSFPNPAIDELNVEMQTVKLSSVSLELVDLTGKVILEKSFQDSFQEGAFKMNVSDLNNGIYILKVTNGDEITTTKVTVSH
ncbi:MAG: hypothetical protein ACJAR8_000650 [Bacteroidia bacterium]|jgi:hypothetical protein